MATNSTVNMAELLAKLRQQQATAPPIAQPVSTSESESENKVHHEGAARFGDAVTYNSKQLEFVTLAATGASCVLIGAAGTGKTTCMKAVAQQLIATGVAGVMHDTGHKNLVAQTAGIVVCSFTRRAVANIRKQMPAELRHNCITLHKLLEFEPSLVDVQDENGEWRTSKRFMPARNESNPLPAAIRTIIVEESSMVGGTPFPADTELLFNQLIAALHHQVQFIFLGDIQQLPPVFGAAILGFKMLELPVVELTEVYRQALESPIIRLAHRILSGKPLPLAELPQWQFPQQLQLLPFKRRLDEDTAVGTLAAKFKQCYDAGSWNPELDTILLPFNKGVGTLELNRHLATHIATSLGRTVHEIVAGFETIYLSVGDKVLIGREDAVITKIEPNKKYFGKSYSEASATMNYWGYDSVQHAQVGGAMSDDDIDTMIEAMAGSDSDDYKRQASHTIYYRRPDSEAEQSLSGAGDLNGILLAYALTVHKAQGSEWNRVYLCLHHSHATMLQRELLYTAVTRARKELIVICEADSFVKGITRQKIAGLSWQEKAEYFKGKVRDAAFQHARAEAVAARNYQQQLDNEGVGE